MKSQHKDNNYPCEECNFKGSTLSILQNHKKSFHNPGYTVLIGGQPVGAEEDTLELDIFQPQ